TMNRVLTTCMFVLTATALLGACDGPSCVANEVPATCDPGCAATEFCNDGTCATIMACDPPTCTATTYCDFLTGNCEDLPAACSPACTTGNYCNDGSCEEIPVC